MLILLHLYLYMKKTMIKLLGVVAAAVMPTMLFAATLNSSAQDYPTLQVTNYTVNPNCTTCWSSNVSASAGNIVSFYVYYHNTGADTANNVRIRLTPQTTSVGTVHSFTATVSADNVPTVTGVATVSLSSAQSLAYISGQTIWRPNQTQFGSNPLLFGQTGAELFNGVGLNIGNITPGWESQGGVAVRFQVSGTNTTSGNSGFAPTVTTQGVSGVAGGSAVLLGYADPAGSTDTMRWFEWGTSGNLGYTTTHYTQGTNPTNFSETISGLMPNTTYYYRAVAQNARGIAYGNTLSFLSANTNWYGYNGCSYSGSCYGMTPIVMTRTADVLGGGTAILNGYIDPVGTTDTVRWFEWGSSSAFGSETQKLAQGNIAGAVSATVSGLVSNTTYYYRAVARNAYGTVYGATVSFTTGFTGAQATYTYGSAPAATTLLATERTGTTAKLNGLVFPVDGQSTQAWFEWGETASLGAKTATVSVGTVPSVLHTAIISGLVTGRTYYYRVVAENASGRANGVTMSFVSEVPAANTTVVVNTPRPTTTVVAVGRTSGTQSLVSLAIEGGAEVITNGEKRVYHVTWKNTNGSALKNVVLRITLPTVMNFETTTQGAYAKGDNAITVDVGALAPGASGETFVFANTTNSLQDGQLVVVTANMVYTTAQNVQGDAVAYVTHKGVRTGSGFAANIFGAGSFVPATLFEWVTLIILVLVLVLLGNHLYGRFSGVGH